MPTQADFEAAADKFQTAAQQVGDLTVAAEGAGASEILRGGSLGRQVPERITASSSSARTCQQLIEDAAATCRERAGIIADYLVRLDIYDTAYGYYTRASWNWSAQYRSWSADETGHVSHPGPHPSPPRKPTPPPEWADVRRP